MSVVLNIDESKEHIVRMQKRTETSCSDAHGHMAIASVELNSLALKSSTSAVRSSCWKSSRPHKMIAFGDSITAAYGVEGEMPCTFTSATENNLVSWASLTADAVNAQLHSIAWSGKGMVRNYGDSQTTSMDPLPLYYNRTLASMEVQGTSNYWDPHAYDADLVLILLGTNDFSTTPHPSEQEFVGGYVDFVERVAKDYPRAALGAVCSPMMSSEACGFVQEAAAQASKALNGRTVQYIFIAPSVMVKPDGCDGHPSVQAQQLMADTVIPYAKRMISAVH